MAETNAQAALQAGTAVGIAYAQTHSHYAPSADDITRYANSFLKWLDDQDAKAVQRSLAADAQRVADRVAQGER